MQSFSQHIDTDYFPVLTSPEITGFYVVPHTVVDSDNESDNEVDSQTVSGSDSEKDTDYEESTLGSGNLELQMKMYTYMVICCGNSR